MKLLKYVELTVVMKDMELMVVMGSEGYGAGGDYNDEGFEMEQKL